MLAKNKPPLVHIVEGDSSVRRALMRLMRASGLRARDYCGAHRFADEVQNARGECVLLDMMMLLSDDGRMLDWLARHHDDMPVIALSTNDDETTRQLACRSGARLFLCKPVDAQPLLDAIERLTGRKHRDAPATNPFA